MKNETPKHCNKPMKRSEVAKGSPWWCSECGDYLTREEAEMPADAVPIVTIGDKVIGFAGHAPPQAFTAFCRPSRVDLSEAIDGAKALRRSILADVTERVGDAGIEEWVKQAQIAIAQATQIPVSIMRSVRRDRYKTVEASVPYTCFAFHHDMSDEEIGSVNQSEKPLPVRYIWARVSREDFEKL